jgi:hypothetical protein
VNTLTTTLVGAGIPFMPDADTKRLMREAVEKAPGLSPLMEQRHNANDGIWTGIAGAVLSALIALGGVGLLVATTIVSIFTTVGAMYAISWTLVVLGLALACSSALHARRSYLRRESIPEDIAGPPEWNGFGISNYENRYGPAPIWVKDILAAVEHTLPSAERTFLVLENGRMEQAVVLLRISQLYMDDRPRREETAVVMWKQPLLPRQTLLAA